MSTNDFEGVRFDASSALQAATQLDALADRIANGMSVEQAKLEIAPAGADEVSVRAAQTLNTVAASFQTSGTSGVDEVRKLAAALRAQVGQFGQVEEQSVLGFAV
ncbi:PE domain-containing protein [Nocardia sp. SYP-A9097]|uniref:PE family protein n=1 Tax=Nocardia sp. SYP-A9097 TaxID=2663237 RepID=UPI00129AFC1B|nr:PE family protein [Nocardia sp. SYP-A9097]MRH88646.1 PE domain-containing protein [Nocardia sp. SYP-A9097]